MLSEVFDDIFLVLSIYFIRHEIAPDFHQFLLFHQSE